MLKKLSILIWLLSAVGIWAAPPTKAPRIQVALLLDTSGSMDGLIDQAKAQLWKIVNELALAKRGGVTPQLEVALYEYGKSSYAESEGYLAMLAPFTDDLDRISEELFKLNTNGGDEYCGMVIKKSLDQLSWSGDTHHYKGIFIAGNEPFTQGPVNFRKSCAEAIGKGIIINTIFCGPEGEGIETHWKEGSDMAEGTYAFIDHNQAMQHVKAPQDKEILQLGADLNKTYLAFGAKGKKAKLRQEAQDQNAMAMAPEVAVERAITKGSHAYKNNSWDLVEAQQSGEVVVEDLEEEALPEPMKGMTTEEKTTFIKKKEREREQIKEKLKKLKEDRKVYLASNRGEKEDTLDQAMLKTIRRQLGKKGYKF